MKSILNIVALALVMAVSGAIAAEKSAGERVDDSWIHTKVKSALVGEGSRKINVEVHEGVVQLAGFIKSDEARDAAISEAGSVKGVKRVSNQLVVQPKTRSPGRTLDDGVVAGRVKGILADDDGTSSIEINVEVNHGVVLLSGFVDTHEERTAAERLAKGAKGVESVINGIDVVGS
jgi:hyperosmotically inducible protein